MTNWLPSFNIKNINTADYNTLDLTDLHMNIPGAMDMLIGSDMLPQISLCVLKQKIGGNLIAQISELGWYLSGSVHSEVTQPIPPLNGFVEEQESLDNFLKRFWEKEELPPEHTPSPEGEHCEKVYSQMTYPNEKRRYVKHLPFKQEISKPLARSFPIHSIFQICRMENRLVEQTPCLKLITVS